MTQVIEIETLKKMTEQVLKPFVITSLVINVIKYALDLNTKVVKNSNFNIHIFFPNCNSIDNVDNCTKPK